MNVDLLNELIDKVQADVEAARQELEFNVSFEQFQQLQAACSGGANERTNSVSGHKKSRPA